MAKKIFYSKIDLWLKAISFLPLVLLLFSGKGNLYTLFVGLSASLVTFLLIVLMGKSCKYVFCDEFFYIKAFPFIYAEIKYSEVKAFYNSHNILSAPAYSLDRIRIDFGKRKKFIQPFALVSPENKEEFYAELEKRTGLKRGTPAK